MKTYKDFKEAVSRAQQAAIAIAKKKSGKYDKDGNKIKEEQGPCWDGYKQVGMKKKGNKMVPNCVPEEVEIGEDKKWHYYNLDRGVYRLQKDNNGKIIGKMHDRQKEMRAGFPNADEVLSTTKQAAAKVGKLNEKHDEMTNADQSTLTPLEVIKALKDRVDSKDPSQMEGQSFADFEKERVDQMMRNVQPGRSVLMYRIRDFDTGDAGEIENFTYVMKEKIPKYEQMGYKVVAQ